MAMSSLREARAFEHVLESAAGPHQFSLLVEKWSDAARAAAAAARKTKGKGGDWRKAARNTFLKKSDADYRGMARQGMPASGPENFQRVNAAVDRRTDKGKQGRGGMTDRAVTQVKRRLGRFDTAANKRRASLYY